MGDESVDGSVPKPEINQKPKDILVLSGSHVKDLKRKVEKFREGHEMLSRSST